MVMNVSRLETCDIRVSAVVVSLAVMVETEECEDVGVQTEPVVWLQGPDFEMVPETMAIVRGKALDYELSAQPCDTEFIGVRCWSERSRWVASTWAAWLEVKKLHPCEACHVLSLAMEFYCLSQNREPPKRPSQLGAPTGAPCAGQKSGESDRRAAWHHGVVWV